MKGGGRRRQVLDGERARRSGPFARFLATLLIYHDILSLGSRYALAHLCLLASHLVAHHVGRSRP
jgi:hypothetical protein